MMLGLALSPVAMPLMGGGRAVPALDLDFLGGALDGRIALTRASAATYFDAAGVLQTVGVNVPRFNYDPITHVARGLLIEEQRTNLLLRSSEFDNAAWNKVNATVTPNVTIAPDGAVSADKLVENAGTGNKRLQQTYSYSGTVTLTHSVYVKSAERAYVEVDLDSDGTKYAGTTWNLTTGTLVTSGGPGYVSSTITAIANGWYRISVTATFTDGTTAFVRAYPYNGTTNYTGDGTSGLYVWGAQLEAGAFPTSYIPTTTATATRTADVASMALSSIPGWSGASWAAAAEWSLPAAYSTARAVLDIHDGSTNNRAILRGVDAGGNTSLTIRSGSATQWAAGLVGAASAGAVAKAAFAASAGDFAGTAAGAAVLTFAGGSVPVAPTTLSIGSAVAGSEFINGHIRRLRLYPRRLANAQLQGLTS